MHRFGVLLSLILVVLFGALAPQAQPVAVAQEATPPAEEMMPEGISFEPVTFATGADLTGLTDLFVLRLGLEPGAALPVEENDPSVGILLVESGAFTIRVEGPVTVTRGAGMSEAIATAEATGDFSTLMESVPEGKAVTLEAEDAAYIPGNVAGEIRNEGQERAVGLGFLVVPGADMTGEVTPTP